MYKRQERETVDMVYDLSDEETAILTSNSIEEHPSEKRIGLINDIISPDSVSYTHLPPASVDK